MKLTYQEVMARLLRAKRPAWLKDAAFYLDQLASLNEQQRCDLEETREQFDMLHARISDLTEQLYHARADVDRIEKINTELDLRLADIGVVLRRPLSTTIPAPRATRWQRRPPRTRAWKRSAG